MSGVRASQSAEAIDFASATTAIDLLPIGAMIISLSNEIVAWNNTLADWTERNAEEVVGRKLHEVFPNLEEPKYARRLRSVFIQRMPVVFSPALHPHFIPIRRRVFHSEQLMVQSTQVRPLTGHEGMALITIQDVTEDAVQLQRLRAERSNLEAARDQAQKANAAKSAYIANMSHEIRTPLTAILGFVDVLLEKADDPDQAASLRTVSDNGKHLLELINDTLDMAKVEAGCIEVELIPVDPIQVVREAMGIVQGRAKAKGIRLEIAVTNDMPQKIETDSTRFRQILINLLGNAIKFTDSGAVLVLVDFESSDHALPVLEVSVIDSGIGMSETEMSRLFRPFTQADASTTRRYGGTGLGLSISKSLASMLGGDITVHSRPNCGSIFQVTVATGDLDGVELIPRDEALTETMADTSPSIEVVSLKGLRLLVADDNESNRRLLVHVLGRAGASVDVVGDGQQAVDRCQANEAAGTPYDLVLMDMQMPVLNGYDAVRKLNEQGYPRPIVALTASALECDRVAALEAGCCDHAVKPIDRIALTTAIVRAIRAA